MKHKLRLHIKELKSYYATFLRKKGIIAEYVDLSQGRLPRSVFDRHYLKVEAVKELVAQVLGITENLGKTLLSRHSLFMIIVMKYNKVFELTADNKPNDY